MRWRAHGRTDAITMAGRVHFLGNVGWKRIRGILRRDRSGTRNGWSGVKRGKRLTPLRLGNELDQRRFSLALYHNKHVVLIIR